MSPIYSRRYAPAWGGGALLTHEWPLQAFRAGLWAEIKEIWHIFAKNECIFGHAPLSPATLVIVTVVVIRMHKMNNM